MSLSSSLSPSSGSRRRSLSFSRRSVRGLRTAAHVARGLFVPKTTGIDSEVPCPDGAGTFSPCWGWNSP